MSKWKIILVPPGKPGEHSAVYRDGELVSEVVSVVVRGSAYEAPSLEVVYATDGIEVEVEADDA